ncbi:MAG: sulfurtransferase TusD, partial [Gammaproteobacteria bacterium]
SLVTLPQDEIQLPQRWQQLTDQYHLEAVVCIASALRRGVANDIEARRFGKPCGNLIEGFE